MKFDRTVAVYVLNSKNEVVMLKHKKLGKFLPPGGHVENSELIHEAAIREVREESGLEIEFTCQNEAIEAYSDAKILPRPLLVQLENLKDHYHEDFVYLAKAKDDTIHNNENHEIGWFTFDEALKLDIYDNVRKHINYLKRYTKEK